MKSEGLKLVEIFEQWSAAFEETVKDDDWSRLGKFLAEDATYINVGFADSPCQGKENIIAYLKVDVSSSDRRFDSRTLTARTPPVVTGDRLSRRWRTTYALAGVPDLVVEGEARYFFAGNLIKSIEEELSSDSVKVLNDWMQKYGNKLTSQE